MAEITEMEMVEKYQRFSLQLENGSSVLFPSHYVDSHSTKFIMRVGVLHFLEESGFISTRMYLVLLEFEIERFWKVDSLYQEERK